MFEQQARDHHFYPLISWDDVANSRIHRTPGFGTIQEVLRKLVKGSDRK